MQTMSLRKGTTQVNGAELYYERRGSGPPVLFIQGASGDAGTFMQVAELLANEFTVVTYDRRGNSRSPHPAGWTQTSMDEQADDAAGLLRALDLAPAAVFGTSGGAVILLNLLLRHPEVLRGAVVHEPPLVPVLPNAAELGAQFHAMLEEALARGGPRGAMEVFLCDAQGEATFEHLDPTLRERMLGNGKLFFSIELPAFFAYAPDAAVLARTNVPVQVLAGIGNRGLYLHDAARWVADHLGTELKEIPGAHVPYLDHPREMVDAIRPFLRQVCEVQSEELPIQTLTSAEPAELVTVTAKDGTPIALWKSGTGPSLLAVHGTAADHTAWDNVVPLLADRFTVYAMDRRGRGASGDAPEYALAREFEDVAAAVDALPGPVHLYGHSFGGMCAIEAAVRTRNLGRLVLYEGGPKPPGLRLFPDDFVARLEALLQIGKREEALATFMLTAAGVTPDELAVLRRQSAWPGRVAAVQTIPREVRAFNDYAPDPARFGTIEAPVLLVVGELTEPRRREMFERLAPALKNARVAVLPGQRHAAHQTAPDLLAAALREFLLADA